MIIAKVNVTISNYSYIRKEIIKVTSYPMMNVKNVLKN